MEQIRGAIYDSPPNDVVFHLTSIDVVKSVLPFKKKEESGEEVTKWRVDLDRYGVDEYYQHQLLNHSDGILQLEEALVESYEESNNGLLDVQDAIAELYEMIIGGDE